MSTTYPKAHVKNAREWMREQVQTYERLAPSLAGEPDALLFERSYFASLLLALDHRFIDRERGSEGGDSGPLGEARLLITSLIDHSGRVHAVEGVDYSPEKSVLKLPIGAPVHMTPKDFLTLAEAYLDEIVKRYPG